MKVIFMGTPDFAVGILEALIEAGHDVVLAVTQPDKPKGRSKALQFPPVKQAALAHNIEVFQPKRIREPQCVAHLRQYAPDIMVVAAFGQILPAQLLEMPPYGCVNVHASLLPKYRGASPIQWAVMNGDAVTGVTTMQMDAGIDTGDILETLEVAVAPDETGGSLFDKLAKAGAALCVSTLAHLADGTVTPRRQEESQATHVGMISKQMGRIDWARPAVEIERLVRGLNPWPSAYTTLDGKTLKIWKASVVAHGSPGAETGAAAPFAKMAIAKGTPATGSTDGKKAPETEEKKTAGTVIFADQRHLYVQTGDGVLCLQEVQLEGKKRMAADAFLRGFPVKEGVLLGEAGSCI